MAPAPAGPTADLISYSQQHRDSENELKPLALSNLVISEKEVLFWNNQALFLGMSLVLVMISSPWGAILGCVISSRVTEGLYLQLATLADTRHKNAKK